MKKILRKTFWGKILLLTFLVAGILMPSTSTACTSFIVSGRVTKDGRPMIFKNRDTGEQNNVVVGSP